MKGVIFGCGNFLRVLSSIGIGFGLYLKKVIGFIFLRIDYKS